MPDRPPRAANAGGFLIAAGALGGTLAGLIAHEPTIGFLAGITLGGALAGLLWWGERRG